MEGLFDNMVYWHWWVFAVVLIIFEVFSPAAFFLWLGVAAGFTGLVTLIAPELSWQIQFLIFAVASVVAVFAGRYWFKRNPISSEQPKLNDRGDELIGKVFKVEQAIVNGAGRVIVGESTWKAVGPDCDIGTSVRVISVDAAVLNVEPID